MRLELKHGMALLAAIGAGACDPKVVPVEVSHVRTDLGYLNSSSTSLGYLYLWDRSNGTLTPVDILNFSPANVFTTEAGASRETKSTRGASISGSVTGIEGIEPAIEAEVNRRLSIKVTNYQVQTARSTIDEMVTRIRSAPEETATRWFLNKATGENNRYLYVLTYKALSSDSAQLEVDRSANVGATIALSSVSGGFKAKLEGASLERFEGKSVPAFLGYYVMRPFYNEKHNYDFDLVTANYRDELIEALRNGSN